MNSVEFAKHIPNLNLILEPYYTEDCAFIPWLVSEEWKQLKELPAKPYVFGHFELPHFLMNAMVSMPDTNEIQADDLSHHGYVFSGHFHRRQVKGNIHYIGNAFPHNYSDANDYKRGYMIIEHGGDPVYHDWPDMPVYQTLKLSEVLHNASILKYDSTEIVQAFESIDEIVHNQILAVDSDHYDKNLLVEIYKNL